MLLGFFDGLGANPIEWLTRNTGKWALILLLASLAVTPLVKGVGKVGLGAKIIKFKKIMPWRRLLGLYAFIIQAIKGLDLTVMGIFALGCATGLLSFVHILSFLLERFHAQAIAVLTGFLFGSLNALWPWKQVLVSYTSSKGIGME